MRPWFVLAVNGILLLGGCSASSTAVPVEGTVMLDGNPLPDATVSFGPLKATAPGPFVGKTDAQGHYTLSPIRKDDAGVAPGEYIVNIITVIQTDVGDETKPPEPTPKEVVPREYRNSTMRMTIPATGTLEANFDMKSR